MKFMPDLQFCKELPEIKPGEYRLKYDLTLRASPGLGTALCRGNYHRESCLKAESKGVYLPNQIFEQICMEIDGEYGVDMPLYES
ncbi:MAG: hypothetical protein ACLR2O_00165 [Coprococcus sp.]